MRWLAIGLGVVVGILVILAGIGYSMPNAHVAQVEADFRASPDAVYRLLSDIENWPEWHPSVAEMNEVGDDEDQPTWRISGPDGSMVITLTGRQPPRRFTTLADGGMFIGRWTYVVEPRSSGARVTVTEEARIDNLVIRGLAVFRNKTATMERMLRALGEEMGERVEPRALT